MRRIVLAASLFCAAFAMAGVAGATVCRTQRGVLERCAPHAVMLLCHDGAGHITRCRTLRPSAIPALIKAPHR